MTDVARKAGADESREPAAWRERAEAGDPGAQLAMGRAYLAKRNIGRARRWLQRALESGNAEAGAELGLMHLTGNGVPPSARDAIAWFDRGAEAGSALASYHAATLRFVGLGTRIDRDAAREQLLAAARGDCPEALRILGFVYARLSPSAEWEPRAFACLHRAACLGDAAAAHACAVRLHEGRGVERDDERASAWMAWAASRDMYASRLQSWATAGAEEADKPAETPSEAPVTEFDWPGPREAAATRRAEDPPVYEVDGLVDPEMCDYVVNRAAPWLEPARTVNPKTGTPERNELRTNSTAGLMDDRTDIAVNLVETDMCHLAREPVGAAEHLAVLRYDVGEEYKPHFDYINPHAPDAQREYRLRGQRIKTIFAYLNEVSGGGETEFPRLGVTIKPERGGGVLFRNVDTSGKPDSASLHAGCPVTDGEKWLATLWIRERPSEYR